MRAGGFPGNPGGLIVSILKVAGGRAPAHQARGRGRRTWRPTERTAGARMVPPGEGNEARGDGRRGVGVSHSTAEAGALSPRDPVEGRGHRQVAPLEGKTANTPRLGPVSTSRQRIAELARQAFGMAVAIAWLPGPAGTRRRVAKLSVEEPDAAEPARPDLWGARVSNDPGLPDRAAPPGPSPAARPALLPRRSPDASSKRADRRLTVPLTPVPPAGPLPSSLLCRNVARRTYRPPGVDPGTSVATIWHGPHDADQDCAVCSLRHHAVTDLVGALLTGPADTSEPGIPVASPRWIAANHASQFPARAPPA